MNRANRANRATTAHPASEARRRVRRAAAPVCLLALAIVGCGGGKSDKKDEAPGFAKAFDNTAQIDTKAADKGMRELKEKADKEAAELREAELEKITSVNPPLPADAATACTEAGAAFDDFKTKRLAVGEDQALYGRWNATKEPDVRKFVENCTALGKIEIGVCLANAHKNAPMSMFGVEATDDFADRCNQRWGGGEAKAPAPTP
jgi:hypothetical protein